MSDIPLSGEKVGPGRMILVVGPSGAGKDTLLAGVREHLTGVPDVHFARRAITRSAQPEAEDHDTLSNDEYRDLADTGEVALCWEAHGLGYVIPANCDDAIRRGETVIANGSRRALSSAAAKYRNLTILLITAPVDILAERLALRGRESREQIKRRLCDANLELRETDNVVRIENTGTIEEGVSAILQALDLG